MLGQFLDKLFPDIAFFMSARWNQLLFKKVAVPPCRYEKQCREMHVENLLEAKKRARASYLIDTIPITSDVAQVYQLSNTVFELNRTKQELQEILVSQVPASHAHFYTLSSNPNFRYARSSR